jgi:ABC-type spermidine/putrescine transport system permease subunit II
MPSERASLPLRAAAIGGLLFLHLPILLIFLYAFTTEEKTYAFPPPPDGSPPPGLTAPISGRRCSCR